MDPRRRHVLLHGTGTSELSVNFTISTWSPTPSFFRDNDDPHCLRAHICYTIGKDTRRCHERHIKCRRVNLSLGTPPLTHDK